MPDCFSIGEIEGSYYPTIKVELSEQQDPNPIVISPSANPCLENDLGPYTVKRYLFEITNLNPANFIQFDITLDGTCCGCYMPIPGADAWCQTAMQPPDCQGGTYWALSSAHYQPLGPNLPLQWVPVENKLSFLV